MSKLPGATSEGGFQFYLLMTTVSEMHPVFVMAGHCHQPQLSATVAQPSQQTMPEADPGGDPREQRNPPFAQNIKIDF